MTYYILWDESDVDHVVKQVPKITLDELFALRRFAVRVRLKTFFPGYTEEQYVRAYDYIVEKNESILW